MPSPYVCTKNHCQLLFPFCQYASVSTPGNGLNLFEEVDRRVYVQEQVWGWIAWSVFWGNAFAENGSFAVQRYCTEGTKLSSNQFLWCESFAGAALGSITPIKMWLVVQFYFSLGIYWWASAFATMAVNWTKYALVRQVECVVCIGILTPCTLYDCGSVGRSAGTRDANPAIWKS